MRYKAQLFDESAIKRALTRISYEIMEKGKVEKMVLVGIKTRGVPIACSIAENIYKNTGIKVPVCELDITFYRDDLSRINREPVVKKMDTAFNINGMEVVLCDDVLFTGRTVRAAIDAVFSWGRPERVQLAVLVDRGHRQLPIRPDYVGKNVPTSGHEQIKVNLDGIDGKTNVELYEETEDEK